MSETISGEACNITTGEELGKEYVCRFALRKVDGLFFVWDKKTPGIDLLEDGADLRITHDGSKYKKVEKIEGPNKELAEPGRTSEAKQAEPLKPLPTKEPESKIEKTMKKVETEDSETWRIARSCATERVFGNGKIDLQTPDEELLVGMRAADKIAAYIVTGQKPTKKKQ